MINEFLKVVFKVDTKDFETNLKQASASMKNFGTRMESFGRDMSTKVTLPIIGIGTAMVTAASDAEETRSKFDTVFRDLASSTREWAETTATAVKRSSLDLESYLATLQDTFVPMGFARDEAAKLSQQMVQLGVDLGSFNNMADADVIRDLTSAMIGNHETVRKFGVLITEATLKQELLNMGLGDGADEATNQQKALARLNIIMNSTTDAQGDAIRTSESFANQMKGLSATLRDLRVEFGNEIIPVLKESFIPALEDAMSRIRAMDEEAKRNTLQMGAFAAAIPLVTWALGSLIKNIVVISKALKGLFLLMRAHPIGALATAMGALSINALIAARDVRKLRADYKELTELGDEDFGDKELARLDVLINDLTKRLQNFSFVGATTEDGIAALRGQYQQLENQLASLIERRAQLTFVERQAPAVDEIIPDIPTAPIKPKIKVLPPDDRIDLSLVEQSIQDSLDSIDFGFPVNSIGFMNEQIALLQTNMMSATDPATILQYQQAIERLQQRIAELTGQSVKLNATWFDFTDTVNQFGITVANSLSAAIVNAKSLADTLKNIGKMLLSTAFQILIRGFLMGGLGGAGFLGSGGGLFGMLGITKANDALITSSGDIVKFHPDDNILAMKDFSGLGGGQNIHVTVSGQLRGEDIFISGTRGGARYSR